MSYEYTIQLTTPQLQEARRQMVIHQTADLLVQEFRMSTRNAQESGEDVKNLRNQQLIPLTLPAKAAPAAPQYPEHKGLKFPDSPDIPETDLK